MASELLTKAKGAAGEDFMPLLGIDHVEFYVGNAKQAAYYYSKAFGFKIRAFAGLETGVRDHVSWMLEQNDARFVLTGGMSPEGPIARHVLAHGDGVRDIALRVPDAAQAWHEATSRGAESVQEPTVLEDGDGRVVRAAIKAYGDTIHSFVERERYAGVFLPGYERAEPIPDDGPAVSIRLVDHIVANVELGKMNEWVGFYARVLGFTQLAEFDDEAISTEYSALMSKVMWDGEGRVKFPINEPAEGKRKSQVDEYLEFYGSAGAQHIALLSDDIVGTVAGLRARGVEFIRVPSTYYGALAERVGSIDVSYADVESLGILADRDEEGYLLQTFTRTVEDRPTGFFEIIERHGSRGFGAGNFKELFVALEREQEARGNL